MAVPGTGRDRLAVDEGHVGHPDWNTQLQVVGENVLGSASEY